MLLVFAIAATVLLFAVRPAAAADAKAGLVKVCDGLSFPEGPAYDGRGNLFFSNCNDETISKVNADGTVERKWMSASEQDQPFTWKKSNGLTFHGDGTMFVCDHGRNAIIRMHPGKRCEVYADSCGGVPFKGPNDLAFDPKGNLYFTDPVGSNKKNPVGCVYRVEQGTRKVTRVADGMAFPNGLAFTANAKYLYVCESGENRILRFAVKLDGTLGPKEPFADLSPDGPGDPDGMAVDSKGNLWVTHFGAHSVLVFDTKGRITTIIRLPHENNWGPTNIEFGGKDMRDVYITDPGTQALYRMRSEVPGLKLFCSPRNTGR